eukprot:gene33407-24232_t
MDNVRRSLERHPRRAPTLHVDFGIADVVAGEVAQTVGMLNVSGDADVLDLDALRFLVSSASDDREVVAAFSQLSGAPAADGAPPDEREVDMSLVRAHFAGMQLSPDELTQINAFLSAVDANDDGKMSFGEFAILMQRNKRQAARRRHHLHHHTSHKHHRHHRRPTPRHQPAGDQPAPPPPESAPSPSADDDASAAVGTLVIAAGGALVPPAAAPRPPPRRERDERARHPCCQRDAAARPPARADAPATPAAGGAHISRTLHA